MNASVQRGEPIVGILGGMGPEATVDLMARIVARTPAGDDADHIHMLVDCNPKVPSRIAALIDGVGESPGPTLADMAARLVASGARILAMPCHTAHRFSDEIVGAAGEATFLDMVALSARHLATHECQPRRIGILASTAVRRIALYDEALKREGLVPVWPDAQGEVLRAICAVKAGDHADARLTVSAVCETFASDQIDILFIACTELSAIRDAITSRGPVVDGLDVLAEAIIAKAQAGTERDVARQVA